MTNLEYNIKQLHMLKSFWKKVQIHKKKTVDEKQSKKYILANEYLEYCQMYAEFPIITTPLTVDEIITLFSFLLSLKLDVVFNF